MRSRCRELLLSAIKGDSTPEGIEIDKYVDITVGMWMGGMEANILVLFM